MRLRALGLLFVATSAGCSLDFPSADESVQQNACSTNGDCSEGSVCRSWETAGVAPTCVTTDVDLQALRLVVTPAGVSSDNLTSAAHILNPFEKISLARNVPEGAITPFSAKLENIPLPITVTYACPTQEGFEPVLIQAGVALTSSPPALGLPVATYTSQSSMGVPNEAPPPRIPPGSYDIYVTPQVGGACPELRKDGAKLPPVLLTNQAISAEAPFNINIEAPLPLTGAIHSTNMAALHGWSVDIVDPLRGRPMSDEAVLDAEKNPENEFALSFNWFDKTMHPVIRLRPPLGQPMPTVYWDLTGALGVSSVPRVDLDVSDLKITPQPVSVTVFKYRPKGADTDPVPPSEFVPSLVTFQSIELNGWVSQNSSYSITLPTDASGLVRTDLPPGLYNVRAVPVGDGTQEDLSIGEVEFEVPEQPSCFCGKSIEVPLRPTLTGIVTTPSGEPLVGVPVVASASQLPPVSFFSEAFSLEPHVPRSTLSETDDAGGFGLAVDPGELDIFVRPDAASGFPWLVRSRVSAPTQPGSLDEVPVTPLDEIALSAPAILFGTFTDSEGKPVAGAFVGAWLPVKSPDPNQAFHGTVIQVAETVTDSDGRYILRLPASISQ